MIQAIIFDLDGTLVQTERLKALSYAKAAMELRPEHLTEADVLEAFKDVAGLSRREVALKLMARFQLEETAAARKEQFGVPTAWQAFVQIRMKYYDQILKETEMLKKHQCPHNTRLLQWASENGFLTGLATMSPCSEAQRVLQILNLQEKFVFVATRDDVRNAKPHPEIYLLVSGKLHVHPENCLVIEDSPAGIKAALNAGMRCIAVTNIFTRDRVQESHLLPEELIVNEPENLLKTVENLIERKF